MGSAQHALEPQRDVQRIVLFIAELGMSSTGLAWTSSDCDAALSNSKQALSLLGKRKREPQANLADERAALLSIRRLRLAYHSHGTKVITVRIIALEDPQVCT